MQLNISPETFETNAELLKVLAHPVRLCLVRGLMENGPCNVTSIQSCLGVPQSTISQHLAKLKAFGVLSCTRSGREVTYAVTHQTAQKLIRALFDATQPI